MAEGIGLEAILADEAFNRGVANYLAQVDKMSSASDSAGSSIGADFVSLGDSVLKWSGIAVGALAAVGGAMLTLAGAFTVDAVEVAMSVEAAFAGVIKTTDGLTSEVGVLNDAGRELKQGFKDLAAQIPISPEQLMRIGELGGQLGIEKEHLLEFTETIAGIGVSTDLSTEEASMAFARFMNIMGTAQGDVDRIGSAVVDLGNNFATTEPDIVNFALRIAGAGKIAGLTEADVLGIGAAMSSVGIEAEAGGTAVQKVLLAMNTAVVTGGEDLETFAATAGVSASEFARQWEADPAQAFAAFVEGLGQQGDEAIFTLEALELKDQRLVRAFLSMANAGDLLTESLDMSTEAWEENTALADEAAQFYATSESKMQIFRNSITNLKDDIGNLFLPILQDMLGLLGQLIDKYAPLVVDWFEDKIAPAVQTLVDAFGDLIAGDVEGFLGGVQDALATLVGPDVAAQVFEIVDAIRDFIDAAIEFVSEHAEEFKGALIGIGAVLGVAAIVSLGLAIAGLASPMGAIVAAAAILGAAWAGDWGGIRTALTKAWEAIQPVLETIWDWLKVKIPEAVEWVRDVIDKALVFITGLWKTHGDDATESVTGMWDTIRGAFDDAVTFVRGLIDSALGFMQGWWSEHGEAVTTVVNFLWDDITGRFEQATEIIAGIVSWWWEHTVGLFIKHQDEILEAVSPFFEAIQATWDWLVDTVLAQVEYLWSIIGILFETGAEVVGQLFELFAALITGDWDAAGEALIAIGEAIWDGVKAAFEAGAEFVTTLVGNAADTIKSLFNIDLREIGANIMQSLKDGIAGAVGSVTDAVKDAVNSVVDGAKGLLGIHSPSTVFKEIGESIVAGLVAGIEEGGGAVADAIDSLLSVASGMGAFGGAAAKMLKGRWLESAEARLEEINAELDELRERDEERGLDPIAWATQRQLLQERVRLTEEVAEAEERILALQKQQEDLAFLQQQMKLLDMIAEHGLDPADILGGLELGLSADMGDLVAAMSRAMEALIGAAQDALGIRSPSTVAAQQIGEPLAEGIWAGFEKAVRRFTEPARYQAPLMAPFMGSRESHYHLAIHTSAPIEPIVQDFRMLEAMAT